jgi:hypothetical protein
MVDLVKPLEHKLLGDMKFSKMFTDYLPKIYERRVSSGLEDLLGNIEGVIVQVQSGDGFEYLKELYTKTPYRFVARYTNSTHNIFCLKNETLENTPVFFVLEPLSESFNDNINSINSLYPNAIDKKQARYVGEIFGTKDKDATRTILQSHDVPFIDTEVIKNEFYLNEHIHFTRMSDFTYNRMGYTQADLTDFDSLALGKKNSLSSEQKDELKRMDDLSLEWGIKPLLSGIDHLAARVLSSELDSALLELVTLTNYYFWGGYDILAMGTITAATRATHGVDNRSPAKVISGNDTPYMVNSLKNGTPMPVEDFVRNYGRRLHHMAMQIKDGDHPAGGKNIDFVVNTLKDKANIHFLAELVGNGDEESLRQTFSDVSPLSMLLTEFAQRCNGFHGFLNESNVAALANIKGTSGNKLKKRSVIGD